MTQSNPLSTEEQVHVKDAKLTANRVFRVAAIIFGGHIAAIIFLLYQALQIGSWQIYTMTAALTVAGVIFFAALRMMRKGHLETGGWLLIAATLVGIITGPLLVAGSGIVIGFIFVAVTYLVAGQTLQAKYFRQALAGSIAIGVLVALTDLLNLEYRLQIPALQSFTPIIAVVVLLSAAFIVVREAWSSSFKISRKLFIAFSILFILGLGIAISGIWGLNRVRDSYQNTLAGGLQIQNLSDHLNAQLLIARRSESDFLLRWKDEGFNTAYQNYFVPNQQQTTEMKKTLVELTALTSVLGRINLPNYSQNQYVTDITSVYQQLITYENSFSRTVTLIAERGFVDTGLEGASSRSVQEIEAKIYGREGLDQLVITMLEIRRVEKDYLLRGDQEYAGNVAELVTQLKLQTQASDALTDSEKAEILLLADNYLVRFSELVVKDRQISESIAKLRVAEDKMQASIQRLEETGEQMANADIQAAQTNSTRSFIINGIATLTALIASIVMALFMSRQISQPLLQLTSTAREIAAGSFNVQAQVTSADEIGTLAQTFNTMTKRLGAAFEDVRRRAAELATVAEVSTATSTILETKRLLQEVVDLTKERFSLYHSHIYLLDEEGRNLVLTAGAGEPGRIMSTEKRSIPLDREQSLVARAARERQGISVNDVTQEPDFLPNPLLPNTRSELAVPMIIGNNVIGVFDIQSDQIGRFGASDIAIQTTLAAQLATSIQNVRSFERSKKQAEFEALVNTINQKIQRTTSIEETLQTAVRELGSAIGAVRVKANISARKDGSNN